ncbi:hypothetical protein HMPREF9134_01040 [Porphyromonas catoniae F0037]|uniref:Uncharacterized protein n=1 Tax=Porphyromonas catoniae F0037 TaxID=1127696 RepID=L1NC81_9PORP|nr:hypothetical protein HMPREF9134_01040 [Porphyromonas catoniae F0037]
MDLPSDELLSPLGSTRGTSTKALSMHSLPPPRRRANAPDNIPSHALADNRE